MEPVFADLEVTSCDKFDCSCKRQKPTPLPEEALEDLKFENLNYASQSFCVYAVSRAGYYFTVDQLERLGANLKMHISELYVSLFGIKYQLKGHTVPVNISFYTFKALHMSAQGFFDDTMPAPMINMPPCYWYYVRYLYTQYGENKNCDSFMHVVKIPKIPPFSEVSYNPSYHLGSYLGCRRNFVKPKFFGDKGKHYSNFYFNPRLPVRVTESLRDECKEYWDIAAYGIQLNSHLMSMYDLLTVKGMRVLDTNKRPWIVSENQEELNDAIREVIMSSSPESITNQFATKCDCSTCYVPDLEALTLSEMSEVMPLELLIDDSNTALHQYPLVVQVGQAQVLNMDSNIEKEQLIKKFTCFDGLVEALNLEEEIYPNDVVLMDETTWHTYLEVDCLFARYQSLRAYDEIDVYMRPRPIELATYGAKRKTTTDLPRTFPKFASIWHIFRLVAVSNGYLELRNDYTSKTMFEPSANPYGNVTAAIEGGLVSKAFISIYAHESSAKLPYDSHVEVIFKSDPKNKKFNDLMSIARQLDSIKENPPIFSVVVVDIPLHRNKMTAYRMGILKETQEVRTKELKDDIPLGKDSALQDYINCLFSMEKTVARGGMFVFKISELLTGRQAERLYALLSCYRNVSFCVSHYSKFLSKEIYVLAFEKTDQLQLDEYAFVTAIIKVQTFLYARLIRRYEVAFKLNGRKHFMQRIVSCRASLFDRPAITYVKQTLLMREAVGLRRKFFYDQSVLMARVGDKNNGLDVKQYDQEAIMFLTKILNVEKEVVIKVYKQNDEDISKTAKAFMGNK